MRSNSIKIIECFNLTGIGLLTEVQHSENGIPPNTLVINSKTQEHWIVKKRILSETLLNASSETYFDCETEYKHILHSFKTEKARQTAVEKELERRKNGIYWYLLAPENKTQKVKPEIGSILKIKTILQ